MDGTSIIIKATAFVIIHVRQHSKTVSIIQICSQLEILHGFNLVRWPTSSVVELINVLTQSWWVFIFVVSFEKFCASRLIIGSFVNEVLRLIKQSLTLLEETCK
jgi:hypothetical protein